MTSVPAERPQTPTIPQQRPVRRTKTLGNTKEGTPEALIPAKRPVRKAASNELRSVPSDTGTTINPVGSEDIPAIPQHRPRKAKAEHLETTPAPQKPLEGKEQSQLPAVPTTRPVRKHDLPESSPDLAVRAQSPALEDVSSPTSVNVETPVTDNDNDNSEPIEGIIPRRPIKRANTTNLTDTESTENTPTLTNTTTTGESTVTRTLDGASTVADIEVSHQETPVNSSGVSEVESHETTSSVEQEEPGKLENLELESESKAEPEPESEPEPKPSGTLGDEEHEAALDELETQPEDKESDMLAEVGNDVEGSKEAMGENEEEEEEEEIADEHGRKQVSDVVPEVKEPVIEEAPGIDTHSKDVAEENLEKPEDEGSRAKTEVKPGPTTDVDIDKSNPEQAEISAQPEPKQVEKPTPSEEEKSMTQPTGEEPADGSKEPDTQPQPVVPQRPKGRAPPPVPKKPSSRIAAFQEMLQKQQLQDLSAHSSRNVSSSNKSNVSSGSRLSSKPPAASPGPGMFPLPGMIPGASVPPALMKKLGIPGSASTSNGNGSVDENDSEAKNATPDVRQRRARGPRGRKLPSNISGIQKVVGEAKNDIVVFPTWTITFGGAEHSLTGKQAGDEQEELQKEVKSEMVETNDAQVETTNSKMLEPGSEAQESVPQKVEPGEADMMPLGVEQHSPELQGPGIQDSTKDASLDDSDDISSAEDSFIDAIDSRDQGAAASTAERMMEEAEERLMERILSREGFDEDTDDNSDDAPL